ncbi:unnamed protein product [Urochloa humidicola]
MALRHHGSLAVLLLLGLAVACAATDFDFFYLVQQAGCCFPGNEKPAADFGIHGIWPNYDAMCRPDAATPKCWPDFCNGTDTLNSSLIRDLEGDLRRSWGTLSCKRNNSTEFWSRHCTCSAALEVKARLDLTASPAPYVTPGSHRRTGTSTA